MFRSELRTVVALLHVARSHPLQNVRPSTRNLLISMGSVTAAARGFFSGLPGFGLGSSLIGCRSKSKPAN